MDHKVRVVITKDDVLCYEEIFGDHVQAKLAVIKELFRLNCDSEIQNAGEYPLNYYNTTKTKEIADLTNLPIKDDVPYCNARNFRYYRVMPDLLNHLTIMCDKIMNSNGVKVNFIALKNEPI